MNITITSNATTASIKAAHPVPRGATHYRFTTPKRKPVIDAIKNLDVLAGCGGKLEYGKATFQGRGRHAKIAGFTVMAEASVPAREKRPTLSPVANTHPVTPSQTKGKLNRIFGFSACAVAKALGKSGVKYAEADRVFRAHGIEMPKASLSVQLGFGRNPASWERHGQPAALTDTQVAELRAEVLEQSSKA
ncbi:MAG: hypothetical protein ACFUZC_07505 [Chthoniobacteraceae bacterium]